MKIIVYSSNTGYTKRLAELLGEKASLPVYDLTAAKEIIKPNDQVIYFGWLMANNIKGLKKAVKLFNVKAICAVGLANNTQQLVLQLKSINNINDTPLFYLQGGYDSNKLKGFNKFVMKMFAKMLNKKGDKTTDEIQMLELIQNGADFVNEESVLPVYNWITK